VPFSSFFSDFFLWRFCAFLNQGGVQKEEENGEKKGPCQRPFAKKMTGENKPVLIFPSISLHDELKKHHKNTFRNQT
jgi:hypothetical protein